MRLTYSSSEPGLSGSATVRRLLPFACVWGLLAAPVAAADTLQTAIADAHAWHPAIQTARAQVRIAAASVNEVGLGNSLTATGDFGASMTERTAELSDGSSQSEAKPVFTSARLSLSKRVFDFGRVRGRVGVEESLLDAARYQLQVVEQQVLHDAVIAYLNVFRARARLELAIKGEELVQSDLKATQERFEVGDVTPTDVAQAEARLADRRADRLNREQDLDQALREYRLATGSDFSENAAYPTELPAVPASEIEVEDSAVNMHPSVLMRRARVDAATRGKDTMVLEILPTFDVTGTATYARNPNTFFESSTDLSIGIGATVPLWSGGRVDAAVRSSEELLGQTRRELDAEMRGVRLQALSAWHRYRSASETITALESSARANRIASDGVRREAEVGNRTTLDVLNANQELLVAEDRLDEARHVLQVAAYGLLHATGRMTAEQWGL